MDNSRLKKVEQVFQEDLAEAFRLLAKNQFPGVLISATAVRISADLSLARVMVSVFPDSKQKEIVAFISENARDFRSYLSQNSAKRMRTTPELEFFLDTTAAKADGIDKALRGDIDNPLFS